MNADSTHDPADSIVTQVLSAPSVAGGQPRPTLRLPRDEVPALERYEILGELGRGGMGVVYKAREISSGRLVALKVIRGADPDDAARLRSEAEAVRRLDHPNIVRVCDVGEHAGLPYIAFEYVDGGSLAARLDGTPLPPTEAAALVERLARAVQHAHERGVIHRDLKPANILLASAERQPPDNSDPSGGSRPPLADVVPRVTDFGIAKRLDGGRGMTRTGEILGTPSYMAPEQATATGPAVGPAADVYALGAILYELLTGRPPFVGPTPVDTVVQMLGSAPVPPSRLQPRLCPELEAICLRCLEKAPGRRYPSALALAEDLARFRDGQPVTVRPRRWVAAARWAGRRPAAAALTGLCVTAVVSLLAAAWGENGRLRAERDESERHRALPREEKPRLALVPPRHDRAPFDRARAAVDAMLSRAVTSGIADVPSLGALRRGLVEEALAFYGAVLQDPGDGADATRRAAVAYARIGDARAWLGEHQAARVAYARAVALRRQLQQEEPDRDEHAVALAELHCARGLSLRALGRTAGAAQAYREGMAAVEVPAVRWPSHPACRRALAASADALGQLHLDAGELAQAEEALRRAVGLREALAEEQPGDAAWLDLGVSRTFLAAALLRARRLNDAEQSARRAVEVLQPLAVGSAPRPREEFARALQGLSNVLRARGRPEGAIAEARRAAESRRQLADEFPAAPRHRRDLALSLHTLAGLLTASQPGEAEALYRQQLELWKALVRDFPDVPEHRSDLGGAAHNLALTLARRGQPRQALELLETAIAHQRAALEARPENHQSRVFLRNHYWLMSGTLLDLARHREAAAAAEQLAGVLPDQWLDAYRGALLTARCLAVLEKDADVAGAERQYLAGRYAEQAVALLRRAIERGMPDLARRLGAAELAPLRDRADFKSLFTST